MNAEARQDKTFTRRVVDFTANVHRACPHCNAPGAYIGTLELAQQYPKIYDVIRAGQPVGVICPCCGGHRSAVVETRKHRKEWWSIRLPGWATAITQSLANARKQCLSR